MLKAISCHHSEDVCQDCLEKKVLEDNEEKLQNEINELLDENVKLRDENIKLLEEKLRHSVDGKTVFLSSVLVGFTSFWALKKLYFNFEIIKKFGVSNMMRFFF